jgi:all-trans-retinol 13,14-reductase
MELMGKTKVVIIGSGMSGLFAGALLAREGVDVTVLEKEPNPGGLLASFRRRGTWFDTGVHYLGSLAPGQVLWKYFQTLDLFPLCQFDQMDARGLEEYRFPGGYSFQVPQGWDAYEQHLVDSFPAEKSAIQACVRDWRSMAEHFPLYNLNITFSPEQESEVFSDPKAAMPLREYLKQHFSDPKLRACLSANNALYGIAPDECPVYIHALIVDSFINSAWRVRGSSQTLCQALVQRLREAGGQIRLNSRVQKLVSENKRIAKAVLDSGEEITADWFISTIHPKQMLGLVDDQAVRPIYRQRINRLEETISGFVLSLSLSGEGVPTPRRNYFLHRTWDTAAAYHVKDKEAWFNPEAIFVSPLETSPGYSRTISIMCPMPWPIWSAWQDSTRASRPEAYRQTKERIARVLIQRLEEVWPGISQRVEFWDGATPLTFRDYTGTWEGSAYGIKKGCTQLRESTLSVRTRSENLLLAGQSVVLPGIVGATISAAAASGIIMGFPNLIKRLSQS